jgi:hypothetical protein
MIVDGLLLGAGFTLVAVGSLWLDARIWIEDYPPDIQAAAGAAAEAPLPLQLAAALVLFSLLLGGIIYSNWLASREHGWALGFKSVFVHTLALSWVVNLVDVVVVDWLVFVTIQPEFVVLQGTRGLAGYSDYWFHLEASVLSWQPWAGTFLIAGVMGVGLPRLWARRAGPGPDGPLAPSSMND